MSPERAEDGQGGARIRAALDAVGKLADEEIALAETALLFARLDAPGADWKRVRRHLSALAQEAAEFPAWVGDDARDRAEALAGLIGCRHDYCGDYDTYDDLRNVNLIHVAERRRGMPVGLGIIWLHCAEVAGWGCYGINFPGHFLLGLEGEAGPVLLDVFSGGRLIEPDDLEGMTARLSTARRLLAEGSLSRPMGKREVLIRLQRNIAVRREAAGSLEDALVCVEDMLRIAPEDIMLWQHAASLHQKLGQIAAAIAAMERVVALAAPGEEAARARGAARTLRGRLN